MYSSSQDTHALIWGLFFLQTREAKLEIELSFVTLPRWQLYISSSSHNHQNPFTYLLGLSKGNAGVEIPAFFFFRSVANRSHHHACVTFLVWRMRDGFSNEHTGWGNDRRREAFAVKNQQTLCIGRSKRIQNMLISFAVDHSKRYRVGPWTLWGISLWANIYEWTFDLETCYISWAT